MKQFYCKNIIHIHYLCEQKDFAMNYKIEKIRKIMSDNSLTQTKLAELSGLSYETINRVLNNKQELKPNTLEKIANALDMSLIDFEDEEIQLGQVHGYLNFCGEVCEIKSFKSLKKWFLKHQHLIESLPKQAKAILQEEKRNASKIKGTDIDKNSIDFFKTEVYDATKVETLPFRRVKDVAYDMSIDLGNMGINFPFEYEGKTFTNSEALYICGLFSNNTPKHNEIQQKLLMAKSGYDAKKQIRSRYEEVFGRKSWNSFNVEWMKWVIWIKVNANKNFKELLLTIPRNTHIIENSTHQNGGTSSFWGCKNDDLEEKRDVVEKWFHYDNYTLTTKELESKEIQIRNSINHIGKWIGCNCMGKILKYIQLCLLENVEPKIDYELLRSKNIYLFGELLSFNKPQQIVVMFDMDFTLVDSSISSNMTWKEKKKHIPQYVVYPGVKELINTLTENNIYIMCVSGNVESVVKETLSYHNIPIQLDRVSGYKHLMPTDNLNRKIAVLKNAMKQIPSDCKVYYVADEADDVEACRQLEIECILATWGVNNKADENIIIASHPLDVLNYLM